MKKYLVYRRPNMGGPAMYLFEIDDEEKTLGGYVIFRKTFVKVCNQYDETKHLVKSKDRSGYFIRTLLDFAKESRCDLDYDKYISHVNSTAKLFADCCEGGSNKKISGDWCVFNERTINILKRFFLNEAKDLLHTYYTYQQFQEDTYKAAIRALRL